MTAGSLFQPVSSVPLPLRPEQGTVAMPSGHLQVPAPRPWGSCHPAGHRAVGHRCCLARPKMAGLFPGSPSHHPRSRQRPRRPPTSLIPSPGGLRPASPPSPPSERRVTEPTRRGWARDSVPGGGRTVAEAASVPSPLRHGRVQAQAVGAIEASRRLRHCHCNPTTYCKCT